MDAKGVRNMYSVLVVVNKHNTARVASCWFIIYYTRMVLVYVQLFLCIVEEHSDNANSTPPE